MSTDRDLAHARVFESVLDNLRPGDVGSCKSLHDSPGEPVHHALKVEVMADTGSKVSAKVRRDVGAVRCEDGKQIREDWKGLPSGISMIVALARITSNSHRHRT